jgi:hypothetical protein
VAKLTVLAFPATQKRDYASITDGRPFELAVPFLFGIVGALVQTLLVIRVAIVRLSLFYIFRKY